MNRTDLNFVPLLNSTRRDGVACNKMKRLTLLPLQHSVITFGSARRETNFVPFSTVVEGNRTGEVRLSDSRGIRRSQEEDVATEQKRVQQLSLELQRALDKLRVKNKEERKLRRKAAVAELKLGEEVERRTSTIDDLLELMQIHTDFMRGTNAELRRLLKHAAEEHDKTVIKLREEQEARLGQEEVQQRVSILQAEKNGLRQQLEEAQRAKVGLEELCKRLQEEKDRDEFSFLKVKQQLELDLMRTQAQLQGVNRELAEAQNSITASDTLMQQVRLFMQMVCQPDFYVVKDRSLQPVDKNRPEPTGFVLVPLSILLQGYTLLLPGDRQDLIESYRARL
ncbi:hypothetical protein TCSYLVIO_004971 [Trypanosoma cruzi]|uniref:Uncharacterized protein n=1 Tax=Trypanosoma cruzi Dm28c TaxID=1416333 RepID=V5BGD4_TRYCR|nr:hypothetical protein TCSYLVIO_004971 [Trypanosoma cruzi]ESS65112.1 hypothetical protein TCDM_06537 [Trypanosoma cruzi Dm28c]KAF8288023.1 hypothetical protein TcBrA4_0017180 [Trypanosoma cruzi]RNF13715.1 hypothetical protein TcG_08175 [Trypanosoma cruzi]